MNSSTATAQQLTAGATIGGGGLSFLTVYSGEITVAAVAITAVASILFGIWNGKIQTARNRINRRGVTEDIIFDLEKSGKSEEYINDFRESLRK
jgi:hypothetical protein